MKLLRRPAMLLLTLSLAAGAMAEEIHDAALQGEISKVADLLENDPGLLESRDERGRSLLMIACRSGDIDLFRLLAEKGADIHVTGPDELTLMHFAAIGGSTGIVDILLEEGLDIGAPGSDGMTPILYGGYGGDLDMVKHIQARGGSIGDRSDKGTTLLAAASYAGSVKLIEYLLEQGLEIEPGPDGYGNSPLFAAAYSGHVEATRTLVENGADLGWKREGGASVLHIAAMRGRKEVAEYLIEAGVDPDIRSGNGTAPIIWAVQSEDIATIKALLDKGADVSAVDDHGGTPLITAAIQNLPEVIALLLDYGAKPEEKNEEGKTSLFLAAERGHLPVVRLLTERGADMGLKDPVNGRTPLHAAAISGHTEVAAFLVEQGVSTGEKDLTGRTAIDLAEKYCMGEILQAIAGTGHPSGIDRMACGGLQSGNTSTGEARIWYTGHSGWAIRTKDHLLVFDYWEQDERPATPCIGNGFINGEDLIGLKTIVFVSHSHSDHFDRRIFEWRDHCEDIRYVFGFEPEIAGEVITVSGRSRIEAGDAIVHTLQSNDSGVGFLVEVDGLTILHPGDHANRTRDFSGPYCPEIDYISGIPEMIDIAFFPVSGCGFGDIVAVRNGLYYAMEKMTPSLVLPMHGGNSSFSYRQICDEVAAKGLSVKFAYPENKGDSFFYGKD